jgi:hypothetical protein
MAFFTGSSTKRKITDRGIPYMWGSGDVTTGTSNEIKIEASDGASEDDFGWSVAIGCGKIAVGAPSESTWRGAVYLYDLDGSNEIKIQASDGESQDYFGWSVDIRNGYLFVGAPYWDYTSAISVGRVYRYDLDGSSEYIFNNAHQTTSSANAGYAIAATNGRIFISVAEPGVSPTTRNIEDDMNVLSNVQTASVSSYQGFRRIGADNGTFAATTSADDLHIMDTNGKLRKTVDLGNGNVDYSDGVAIGCGQIVAGVANYGSADRGAIKIFDMYGENEKLVPMTDAMSNYSTIGYCDFGSAVATGFGRIAVGGVMWTLSSISTAETGSEVFLFDLDGNFIEAVSASDGETADKFGSSSSNNTSGSPIAIGPGKLVVGAPGKNSNRGAVYVYDMPAVYTFFDALNLQRGEL